MIHFFLWLTLKQRLLTNAERVRRGIGSNNAYGSCGQDYEDVFHVFRDCLTARTIWDKLISEDKLSSWAKQYILISKTALHKPRSYLHSSPLARSWVCLRTYGSVRLNEGVTALEVSYVIIMVGGSLDGSSRNSNSTLIKRILQVLNMSKQWKIQHLPREENSITDSLAKSVRTRSLSLRLFEDPPLLI
ncbi:hypothetical protein Goklo_001593 [Gossypium klotzschianum]|uniref:Reverse transcriptase zinc-binding domain-containing protein n=1 Tax=Gossypium klotzschianum TaxID=34286 RepID=A0A7J8W0W3_9ROSI|nr:hypothetical protein [Gossypium klotzschianum]